MARTDRARRVRTGLVASLSLAALLLESSTLESSTDLRWRRRLRAHPTHTSPPVHPTQIATTSYRAPRGTYRPKYAPPQNALAADLCVTKPQGGLSDRMALFRFLSAYIGEGQTVAVAEACAMLAPSHNEGKPIPCGDPWGHWRAFMNFPQNVKLATKTTRCAKTISSHDLWPLSIACDRDPACASRLKYFPLVCNKYAMPSTPFNFVKIRRGDTLHIGNNAEETSVSNVEKKYRPAYEAAPRTTIYSTDETGDAYRKALRLAMRRIDPRAIFLDGAMRGTCGGNNYCVYCSVLRLMAHPNCKKVVKFGGHPQRLHLSHDAH